MSRIGRAAARLAARLHPAAWRARYGAEMSALIDDSDSTLADAGDLARSAAGEHLGKGASMRFEPAHRHPGMFASIAGVLVAPTLAVVAFSILGHELGLTAVATATDPVIAWIDTVRPLDLFLVLAPLAAFLLAMIPLLDLRMERDDETPAIALRMKAMPGNLLVGGVALLVGAALVWHILVESVLRVGA